MNLIKKIAAQKNIRLDRLFNWYPVFRFIGIKIKISNNYKEISIKIPLRWYIKNNTGIMFGGVIGLASDPFPSIVFERIFDNCFAYSTMHKVEYLSPTRSSIHASIIINDSDIDDLKTQLKSFAKAQKTFNYVFIDKKRNVVAKITSEIYLRRKY